MAKKYHTIDELLEQSRMNESDNFSVGDGKSYHTIDEIKSAAEKQGLLPQSDTRVAAPVVYSKQAKPSTAKLDPMIAARERVARVATQTAGAVGSGIISSIINSRQNMNPILRKAAEERVEYERNAASPVEKLQKEVDAPIDLYDVHDVQLALSNIPDVHETAEWFVKYRRGGVLRSDENITKYNKIKELIDQNVSSARIARSQEYADKIAYEGEDGKSVNYNDLMIGKVAQNRIQDIGLSPDDARRQLYELNTGNYNVMDSQPVNMQALQSAGWNVTGDMTNFTQPVSDDDTHKAAVFSPVVYDDKGNVSKILSPQELDAYALKVLRGEDDTLNLKITDTYEGRYASSLASENAQRVRRLSERAYNDTDFTPLLHDAGTVPGEDSSAAKQKLKEAGVDWDEYLTYQQREDEIKRSQQAVQNYANWSTQNAGTATLATGANILMSPGKALDYLVNIVGNAVDRVKAGDNKFSVYNLPDTADDWATNLSGASGEAITESIRSGVRGNGDNEFLNWLGDAAANTYGGVTSGIQSALTHATCFALLPPGVAEATSLTIMSGEAANDAYHEVLDNGGTIGQATMYSVAAGVNEYIGEKISLENLLDMKQMFGKQKAKEIIIGILKQGIVEGSEEVVTENLNEFADRVINADKSQYERSVQMYLEQGYQEDEARKKASQDFYARVAWAGYGGFIGGIFPGVGKTALNTFKSKLDYDQYTNTVGSAVQEAGNTQKLIDQAYAMDDKKIKAQADKAAKYDAKQGQGNVVTNLYNEHKAKKETGKLYASMQKNNISRVASAEEAEIKTALSKAYAEKIKAGVNDKSVSKVVNALYKSEYTNEPLSRSEQRMISSDNAKAALSDVQSNEDVIRSQINRAQRRATEDMASTAALTGTKEQVTEKPAKIDIDDFNLSDDGKTYTADGGEQVDIKSISSVDADDIRVELSNGNTESVKALDLGSEDQAVVYQGIMDIQTRLGAPVTASFANAVVNEYNQAKAADANLNTTDFIYGVEEAVRKGYMNDNGGYYAVNLSESAREVLFDEGRKIAQEHTKAQQKSVQSRIKGENSQRKGTVTYEDGIERSRLNERQQVGVDVVTHIAEETGIDVVFFRSTKDGKGRYSSNFITKNGFSENGQAPNGFWHNGKMYIDVNAGMNGEGLILFTAAHEIVHMIREGSPESFKALADFLVENYAKKGVDVNKLVLKEMTRSTNLNYDAAYEEVIAQSCESLLRDIHQSPEMAKKLYQKDKGLATKIKNILNRILNAVKKWYGVAKPQSVEANYVLKMKDALSEIYDKYIAGIHAASENLRNMEKPADEGGAKFSIRKTQKMGYADQLEQIEKRILNGSNSLYVGVPSDSLQKIGITNAPFVMNQADYRKARRKSGNNKHYSSHSVPYDFFESMPDRLSDIGMAIDNGNKVTLVTDYLMDDTNGNEAFVIAGFWQNQPMESDTVNQIKSVYPLNDTVLRIKDAAEKGKLVVIDEKKAENMLATIGVQPSEVSRILNLAQDSLSQSADKVKRQSRSDADYLSAVKRGDMETAQSMVDEAAEAAGYTVKAYHSGENGITKFQSGNSAGLIYFAFSKQSAKKAARSNKAIYSAFLSIQKPVNTRDSAIDWYYAEDGLKVAQWRREGFDSVYVKDEAGISVAVFNPEQVKSADPVTYDDNGDVIPLSERFNESNKDIRFSLRDNVEETRDLIAVHNLTEEKLLKSLRLGGLPMPSVAVIKAENGHKGYGDISIVFPKETIDPSENRNNKLYGGDVWSPTYPSIDYEVDTKKANKIYTRAREALRKPAAYSLNPVTFHPENIADRINSYGGEQGFIEHYKNDYGMKQFYLAEQNQAVPERYVEKRNEISDVDKEFYSFLADQLGKEAFSQEATKTGREWNNRYADDLDNARIDYMRSVYGELSKEEEENLRRDFESERPVHKFRIAMSVQGYLENGGVTVERKLDEDGIKADIDKLVDQSKYEEWLKELFNGIEKSSGIYNGTDYYTSSGNRRSFAQTHYTETLANVVRVMKSQDNGDSFFGGNGLWAIAAKNYGTIEEMKADKDRLTNLSDEERQEISNRFGERFTEIASSIANDGDNEFLALDNAYGNICDAVRNTNTKSGLLRELQKYHHKATVATVDDILDLISDVGNMPVNYFEAKPQRAIKFNEVSTAVIPDNASQALRTALDKAGVKYVEYASGNEEARTEILNSLEDVKFQSRDNDLYFGETDDAFDIDFGEDDSVENLIAREFVTHHEDIGEVLRNVADIELPPKKVESIVNRVIRDNLFGRLDAEARHTLSIELQLALERVDLDDAQSVSDEIIGAVRKAIEGSTVVDDKAVSDYNQLRDVFKGKKFYLTDEQVNQLKEHDMTLDSYRRAMMGKVTIVKRENAKRSISGGYADANELSLMGLHDVLESPDEILGFRSWEWDEKGYDAPNIIKEAFETLRDRREQPITNVYSDEAIDERAVAIAAKITGGIVEAKYNSKQNPYVTKLVADLKQKRTEAVNKQKEKNRQKLAELKQKERERAEKREQDIREKYREQRARGYENRKRTELRGKIRKLMNSFQSRLTKPHDGSYVPRELISQTVEILNSINMDTGRSAKLSEKIAALRNTYDGLKEDAQAYAAYDDTISAMLRGLSESLGNTSIMNMSLEQLKQTYDTLRSLDHYIRESVKMTDTDEKRTAHQLGREMIAETKDVPKEHSGLLSGYIQTQLRADVMFNRLAGFKKNSTWSQMARMLNDGQLHMTQLQMEFSRIFADVLTDTKQLRTLSDTKHLVDVGLVDDDGNKVPITRGMMLSLYMHLLNEDNMRHVERGGLTIPSMKEYYKGDLAKAFGSGQRSVRVGMIDFSQYAEGIKTVIEEQLTDYEIEWIEKAHEFFDGASREALNDTTMKLYHFKKANVDNYFPIHTDSNYRAASFESITRDMSLENSGFMKERIKASNPILLEDIVDVINDQIQKVSKYCGLTIPIKNFQKVYGTTLAGFETSLQKEINKKFSGSRSNTSATKYIDNLITDLTSGRQTSDGPFAKFFSMARGNLAAATLTLNVRVAIAQAASYPTAAAEIGWKPLLKAFVKGGKNNRMISGADRAYIEEHTPLLWLRTQGYSNTEIGDIKEIRKQRHQIEGKVKKALGWIEFFDGMTVGRLFYAAQYYVDEQFPTLKRGSEEYKQKVAEVYNDVIEKTQPNYTTMQRPDILRNPNALVKSMTMFMTQRLQNFNIVYDAVGTYNKYRKDLTAGKNGVTAQDLRQAKTKLRRAVVSQTVAALTIVGMKMFADMLMHSMNAYRDDDDELTAESVSLALLNNFADTIFGSVLFGSDLYSLLKSAVNKEMYYGISLSGVDSLKDALTAITNIWKKGINHDTANKAATTICQLMGIPLNNAEKIGKAIYNWGSDFSSGSFMEAGVDRTNKQNIHRAEMRYTSGDTAGAKELLTAMIEQKKAEGKTDKEAKSWLRSQLTSTYKPRYVQAVKDNNTEERTAIRQFLYQSGAYGSLTDLDKTLSKWVDK